MPTKIKSVGKKKAAAKKQPVAKKPAVKKVVVSKTVVEKMASPVEKIIYRFKRQFVFVPKCSNCDHVPMRINKLVALMSILVAILSGMVIAQGQFVDLSTLLVHVVSL